ncbi:MAG: hypothetical protein IVW57_00075 [Ktedonobacterales bacterium]|nr:hypothetical protein [Ktedonobacterales bacterium]
MPSISDSVTATTLVTMALQLVKPFMESVPAFAPTSKLHDPTLRLINVLLNVAVVCAMAATAGTFTPANWLSYLLVAAGQSVGSHVVFSIVSGPSAAVAPTPAPVDAPAAK